MIHRLHELGPDRALPLLEVPRHEITVSSVVARRLELAYQIEKLRIVSDVGMALFESEQIICSAKQIGFLYRTKQLIFNSNRLDGFHKLR
jgi:hypothetical protein